MTLDEEYDLTHELENTLGRVEHLFSKTQENLPN